MTSRIIAAGLGIATGLGISIGVVHNALTRHNGHEALRSILFHYY